MSTGPLFDVGTPNSVIVPEVVIRPMLASAVAGMPNSLNQKLPSERGVVRVGDREHGARAGCGDPPDLVAGRLREPQAPVRAGHDRLGRAVSGRNGELGDVTRRGGPGAGDEADQQYSREENGEPAC